MSNTDTQKTHDTSSAANGRVGSSDSSALWSEIYRLRAELNIIRDYDRDSKHGEGICPYGCDCPSIADKALRESLEWENLMSREELLTLKVAQLALHRDFVGTAAKVLLHGVRPVSKHQALVLRSELEELKRRCDDAAKVDALSLPNAGREPRRPLTPDNP